MSEVSMGNLYDLNKSAMQNEKALSSFALRNKLDEIKNLFFKKGYFMLLCHERRDYTVFNIKADENISIAKVDLKECLKNRGEILAIDKTEDDVAYEIWLRIDGENFVYYMFPYDMGVIEC